MATGWSASGSGWGPNRGCVPTTGPGHAASICCKGISLTEVMSASTAAGGRCGHTLAITSLNTAAGTQMMARSAPAQAGARISGVRGTSTPSTFRPALRARPSSMAPMRPVEPTITVFTGVCGQKPVKSSNPSSATDSPPLWAAGLPPLFSLPFMPYAPKYSRIAETTCAQPWGRPAVRAR